jgi:hypothetical protein
MTTDKLDGYLLLTVPLGQVLQEKLGNQSNLGERLI